MLSSSPAASCEGLGFDNPAYRMTIGNAGQQSKLSLTGVPWVQKSRRSRDWGEPKIIYRHLRHTWTSLCHFQGRTCERGPKMGRSRLNIFESTSSGSHSIAAGFPTTQGSINITRAARGGYLSEIAYMVVLEGEGTVFHE